MRSLRVFVTVAILFAPFSASAAAVVSSGGSPFANVNPFFLPYTSETIVLPYTNTSQMAATESSRETNEGTNDICYDEAVSIKDGKQVAEVSKGKNFEECKKQNITKADCSNKQKAALVGKATYTLMGTDKPTSISRCQKQPNILNQNCIALGDSNAARLTSPEFKNPCNGGGAYSSDYQCNSDTVDPSHPACQGRTPQTITETIRQLPDGSLEGAKTVLSSGTNDLSELEICKTDPASCPIDQSLKAAMEKGADPANGIYCQGVGADLSYNAIIKDACERNGGTFLDLPVAKDGNWHATDAGYQGMLDQIGQITTQDENLFTRDFGSGGDIVNNPDSSLPTRCGVDGISGNIMSAESSCGAQNWNSKSSVSGPYHFLCPTWNTYATTCQSKYVDDASCSNGYRNDTAISTDVMNCMNGYYEQAYGDRCAQAGLTLSSCQYAIHVNGEPTFKNMLSIAETNPSTNAGSLCGSVIRSDACSNNFTSSMRSGTMTDLFAEYDKRLGGSGSIGSPTVSKNPTYEYEVRFDTNNTSRVTEIIDPKTGERMYVVTQSQSGSPFGSMGQMMLGNSLGGSLGSLFKGFSTQPSNTTQGQTKNPLPPPASVSITAAPSTVKKGENVAVNWTSNATLLNPPCQVTQNGTVISQANAGNRTVATGSSTPPTLTFVLMCKAAQNGQTVQQSAVVNIQ